MLQLVDHDVGTEVIHAIDRHPQTDRECFRRRNTNEQGTSQTRSCGDGDRVDVSQTEPSIRTCPLDGRDHCIDMCPACHFGDDTAEPRMLVDTGSHRIGQQRRALHDADTGFVT